MAKFSESIQIQAPVARVWAALADIGSIERWNPSVKESHQTTDGEVTRGAGRHCGLGGKNYLVEEVVTFEPQSRITFRITETNLPFEAADIRFTLAEETDTTVVTVSPEYLLKFGLLGKILDTLMVRMAYRKGMKDLLQGLKQHVETAAD